jgi:ribonuclease E
VAAPAPIPEPELELEPAPEPAPEPAATFDEAPRRARKDLPAEGVVVSSTAVPTEDAKPKKGGWWQRGFFGN